MKSNRYSDDHSPIHRNRRAFEDERKEKPANDGEVAIKSGFSVYCEQTSLHGWQYFVDSISRFWRIHWVLIVLISIGVAIFFVATASIEFHNATIITTIDSLNVPLTEIFFPAITLCSINQIRRSYFHAINIENNKTVSDIIYKYLYEGSKEDASEEEKKILLELFNSEAYIWRKYENELFWENFDINNQTRWQEFLQENSGQTTLNMSKEADFTRYAIGGIRSNLIVKARFGNEERLGSHPDFVSQYGSDYGICSQFFPQIAFDAQYNGTFWDKNMLGHLVTKGAAVGKENGLSLLVDAQSFDYMYHLNAGEGFKLAVHHHKSMPIMSIQEIDIKPGGIFQVAITPTLVSTSEKAVSRFEPEERNCYEEGELPLENLRADANYRYDMTNCLFESAFEKVLEECDCYPSFHSSTDETFEPCYGRGITCMNGILHELGKYNEVDGKVCLAACEDQINEVRVTSADFPNRHTFEKREEFCLVYSTIKEICNDEHKRKFLEENLPDVCNHIDIIDARIAPNELCNLTEDTWDPAGKWGFSKLDEDWKNLEHDLFRYTKENLAVVNIYIKDPAVTKIIRDEKISPISFIANVGGLMGLCMGFSLVSSWEIIFHFGHSLFKRCKAKKQVKQTSSNTYS